MTNDECKRGAVSSFVICHSTVLPGTPGGCALEAAEQFEKANGVANRVNLAHLVAIHRADFRSSDAAAAPRGQREHFRLEVEIAAFRREEFRGEGSMEHSEAALRIRHALADDAADRPAHVAVRAFAD